MLTCAAGVVIVVIPAQAGNQLFQALWFPACAGMTWLAIAISIRRRELPTLPIRRSPAADMPHKLQEIFSAKSGVPLPADRSHFVTLRRGLPDSDDRNAWNTTLNRWSRIQAVPDMQVAALRVVQVAMVLTLDLAVTPLRHETTLPECRLGLGMCIGGMERVFCAQVLRSDEQLFCILATVVSFFETLVDLSTPCRVRQRWVVCSSLVGVGPWTVLSPKVERPPASGKLHAID
jgi:hypothetical protein